MIVRDPTEAEANEALQRLTVREGNAPHSRTIIRLLTKVRPYSRTITFLHQMRRLHAYMLYTIVVF